MLVIRILGLQAALVAAQLLNVTDVPVVGDVLGGLLGGGTTATPDVVAVPDPVATPEPTPEVVDEPDVVVIPETVPAPVEVTPEPSPEPIPEPTPEPSPEPTPEPAVVVPPVVVVPTPEPAPVVQQQQPPADSPAAPAPAATPDAAPAAVFIPPAQQQPAAAPAAASPSTNAGAGGVILANPSPANVAAPPANVAASPAAPAANPGPTAASSPGMSVFVPPAVAAAAAVGTTTLVDANGVPTSGPSPDGSVAQDIPNANTNGNTDLTNGQVIQDEDGGMPKGTKIAVGVAGGAGGVVVLVVVMYVFWKRRMRRSAWRKKLEGPSGTEAGEAKFNVAGSILSGSDGGKVEWVETRGHDVTFDFGFEKEEARIAHGRGASASGFSTTGGMEKDVEAGYRVELEGDSPPVSRGR